MKRPVRPLLMDIHVVILAAGKGTRMKSALPKVLHRVGGQPLIEHVLDRRRASIPRPRPSSSVTRRETLKQALPAHRGLTFVVQEPQLGTAHALMTAEPSLAARPGPWFCCLATCRCWRHNR